MQQIISLKPLATCHFDSTPYPDTESLYEKAGDKVTTADVLEKLFDATGMDIVGDYFSHLQDPSAVTLRNVRLCGPSIESAALIYSDTTADAPNRMAIIGSWNAIYGMRPEMLHPDAFSILPGRQRP